MKSALKAKTFLAGATISLASCAFGLAGCARESSAGELLDAATQTLNASGLQAEKGLSFAKKCYPPNPNLPYDVVTGNGGCSIVFTGVAVKNAAKYDMVMACATDATTSRDCQITKLTAL